jgi:Domain of unknown function (DUF4386)
MTTGALLITATAAVLAARAVEPALTGTGSLRAVAGNPDRLTAAALLYLIAAATSVGIAIALYPLLRKVNGALALGAVVFRTIEAVFYAASVVGLLSVLHLGQRLAAAPPDDAVAIHQIADSLLSMRDQANLIAVSAFCVGALICYGLLYRSRLVPRWMSFWGLLGALLLMSACLLALFSSNPVTGYTFLILPIAVQEMVLAGWLLIRGFGPTPSTSGPSTENSAAHSGTTATVGG